MSSNLVEEIAAKAATLPVEQQRKVLEVVETLATQAAQPRMRRSVFGDLEHLGVDVSEQDIEEARRERWRGYMKEDMP